jgi:hypothetical protein
LGYAGECFCLLDVRDREASAGLMRHLSQAGLVSADKM